MTARDGQSAGAYHVSVYLPLCLFTAAAGCALSIVLQGGGSPVSAPWPVHVLLENGEKVRLFGGTHTVALPG